MGAALKKGVDYTLMNYTKWAAWGVIDIEKLERHQRRNYINHVREEWKLHSIVLECGGNTHAPYYIATSSSGSNLLAAGGMPDSFKRCCQKVLEVTGGNNDDPS